MTEGVSYILFGAEFLRSIFLRLNRLWLRLFARALPAPAALRDAKVDLARRQGRAWQEDAGMAQCEAIWHAYFPGVLRGAAGWQGLGFQRRESPASDIRAGSGMLGVEMMLAVALQRRAQARAMALMEETPLPLALVRGPFWSFAI